MTILLIVEGYFENPYFNEYENVSSEAGTEGTDEGYEPKKIKKITNLERPELGSTFVSVVSSWVYTVRFSAEFAGSHNNLSV